MDKKKFRIITQEQQIAYPSNRKTINRPLKSIRPRYLNPHSWQLFSDGVAGPLRGRRRGVALTVSSELRRREIKLFPLTRGSSEDFGGVSGSRCRKAGPPDRKKGAARGAPAPPFATTFDLIRARQV
ncbi:hypothetical protein GWI33_014623 [Rhynchophorus ferrugineus]|uniref:Uncharacterized protein n=1 Tax=Rhynchophorus ferrugineus TaxID=354439 RepID=A0A834M8X2_RHYFE|nr:hypothetical protein GWI33_014623 [Rhynchophorus ferrugineus]